MIGLGFLVIVVFWGWISVVFSKFLVKKIPHDVLKKTLSFIFFLLCFFAPVADDIVGGFQFRRLCNAYAVLHVDENKATGQVVIYQNVVEEKLAYYIPITKKFYSFRHSVTDDIVLSWTEFDAEGGWLSHMIGFPSGNPPYTFDGHCAPEGYGSIFKKLRISIKEKE